MSINIIKIRTLVKCFSTWGLQTNYFGSPTWQPSYDLNLYNKLENSIIN